MPEAAGLKSLPLFLYILLKQYYDLLTIKKLIPKSQYMKINLLAAYLLRKTGVLILLLYLMNTMFFSQNKVYANDQSANSFGVCLSCSVLNPSNAAGNNEDDYSTLIINAGALGRVEQTLYFPTPTTKLTKLTIGIGTESAPLSIQLLKAVSIDVIDKYGSVIETKNIDNNLLKIGQQGATRATIEFTLTKSFNRIKVNLNGGLLSLNTGIRIYYAYFIDRSVCDPLADALYQYSFEGNTQDLVSNFNLTSTFLPLTFANNTLTCDGRKGLSFTPNQQIVDEFTSPQLPSSLRATPKTVSFWARMDPGNSKAFIELKMFGAKINITPDTIKIKEDQNFTPPPQYAKFTRLARPNIPGKLNFYTIVFSDTQGTMFNPLSLCLYVNAIPSIARNDFFPPGVNIPPGLGIPEFTYCTSWSKPVTYTNGMSHPMHNDFSFSIRQAEFDELIIYNKSLDYNEIQLLKNTFNSPTNILPTKSNIMKTVSTERNFTVSPNPTSGQITIDGNILLIDSDISVRNTSGTEVYHSKFKSKTFDLPPTLPGGVYILTVNTTDGKIYSRKIILTR
ncbi:T9SS type A sorting domain-containing protein [Chryseobacterium sp. CH25]|uniref:T9SS type A sorting domain-containing protein n=2 Tax=unclassified Chryseobacterium TaxID=2593645 RepID=UPI00100AC36B|nr:T9SS type A sorting domain-containing protein [Chryseobacterium sp. CH25]RXM51977.1 hypothetical protein BOQ64_08945 [Chryseobacterium sp. CH25]